MPSFEERVSIFISKNDKAVFGRRLSGFENSVASHFLLGYHEQFQLYFEKNDFEGLKQGLKKLAPAAEQEIWVSRQSRLMFVLTGFKGLDSAKVEKISEVFNKSGLPTEIDKNIKERIWKKLIANCVMNPLTAIFKAENGKLLKCKDLIKLIIDEFVIALLCRLVTEEGGVVSEATLSPKAYK